MASEILGGWPETVFHLWQVKFKESLWCGWRPESADVHVNGLAGPTGMVKNWT
jgi:hypothetical protein